MKKILRSAVFPIITGLGLERLLWPAKSGTVVLMYHGVCAPGSNSINGRHIAQDIFEEHVQYLRRHFNFISLNEVFTKAATYSNGRNLCITFDDGFENNLLYAKPILEEYQIPATIFVTSQSCSNEINVLWNDLIDALSNCTQSITIDGTHFVNLKKRFIDISTGSSINDVYEKRSRIERDLVFRQLLNEYKGVLCEYREDHWRLLDQTQLIELNRGSLIDIQSHTHGHYHLDCLTEPDLFDELDRSKRILEETLNRTIDTIAFPYGRYNQTVKRICREVGYTKLVAVDYHLEEDSEDDSIINRFGVSGTTTVESNKIHFWKEFNSKQVKWKLPH